jgi:hypothetical protein
VSARRVGVAIVAVALIVIAILWRGHEGKSGSGSDRSDATSPAKNARSVVAAQAQRTAAGRRIAGRVLLEGAGVAAASVRVVDIFGNVRGTVSTGATGEFALAALPLARYLVIAEKPTLSGVSLLVDLRDPAAKAEEVALVLHACIGGVHGSVRDAAGGTIAGARVALGTGDVSGPGTVSDATGNYELCTVLDDQTVIATADGYAQQTAYLHVSGRIRRDFLLAPEGVLAGRVIRADDKSPVADAEVTVHPERFDRSEFAVLRATTDADGRFRVAGASIGRYLLDAKAPGLLTDGSTPALAEVGASDEVVVEVVPAVSVTGTVVEGTRGVAGARLGLTPTTRVGPWRDIEAVTDADGTFVFDAVGRGEYGLTVAWYEVAHPVPVVVEAKDIAGLKIEVHTLGSITGTVLRGGKPVEGAAVNAGTYVRATTDAAGNYLLRGVSAGKHQVYAESKRIGAFAFGPTVELRKGEQKTGVDVELDLSGSIGGRVLDQDGAPVSGAVLTFSLRGGRDFGTATSDENGSFKATTLSGGGVYDYDVRAGATASARFEPADGKAFAPIAVADGHTEITGLEIRVKRRDFSISGHVIATSGEPLADVIVRASRTPGWTDASTRTDETGAFVIGALADGLYQLQAVSPHSDELVQNVASGSSKVVIRMPEPGTIEGVLEGFTERPEVVAMRIGSAGQSTAHAMISGDHFAIRGVPPGTYTVRAQSASGSDTTVVDVPERGTVQVTLHRKGFGRIAGTALDTSGTPVAGVRCFAGSDQRARVDARGAFWIDGVTAGDTAVMCMTNKVHGMQQVTVIEGKTVDVTVRLGPIKSGYTGFKAQEQPDGSALVTSIEAGGPAARAGLAVGDRIVEINGVALGRAVTLAILERLPPGTPIPLEVKRGDKRQPIELTLGEAP